MGSLLHPTILNSFFNITAKFIAIVLLLGHLTAFAEDAPKEEIKLSYSGILEELRYNVVDPTQRAFLVQKIENFPSSHALSFLMELIHLDRDRDVLYAARKAHNKIKKVLEQTDPVVIAFRCLNKDYSLRKTIFIENLMMPPFRGDVVGYARFYVFDKLLECELKKNVGEQTQSSIYSSSTKAVQIPTQKVLNKQVRKILAREFDKYALGPQSPQALEKKIQVEVDFELRKALGVSEKKVAIEIDLQKIVGHAFDEFFKKPLTQKKEKELFASDLEEKLKSVLGGLEFGEKMVSYISKEVNKFLVGAYRREEIKKEELRRLRISPQVITYYSEKRVLDYLWRKWMDNFEKMVKRDMDRQMKRSLLKVLIEKKLGSQSANRDDFGPQARRALYDHMTHVFKKYNEAEDPQAFLEQFPDLRLFVRQARSRIQGLWFDFPSLQNYKKKDEANFETAKKVVEGFYAKVFNPEILESLKAEAASVFELIEVKDEAVDEAADTEAKEETKVEAKDSSLESKNDKIKKMIATNLKIVKDITVEDVWSGLDFLFKTAQALLLEEKSQTDAPSIAFIKALGEARGRYYVLLKEDRSREFKAVMGQFFALVVDQLNLNLRRDIFSYLENKLGQFKSVYQGMVEADMTAEQKNEIFDKVVKAFQQKYPAELIFVRPDWIIKGEATGVVELEYHSFYADETKKPGETYEHFYFNDPVPAITLFQWTDVEPSRLYRFNEKVGAKEALSGWLTQGLKLRSEVGMIFKDLKRAKKEVEPHNVWVQEGLFLKGFFSNASTVSKGLLDQFEFHPDLKFYMPMELFFPREDFFSRSAIEYKVYF